MTPASTLPTVRETSMMVRDGDVDGLLVGCRASGDMQL